MTSVRILARGATGDAYDRAADSLRLRGFWHSLFLEFIGQRGGHQCDSGQLLANAVVQIMANPALLAIANFQNLAFQAFAFGDVARRAFDFDDLAGLFDKAGADFQADPLAGGGSRNVTSPRIWTG
jgi:hypothetical protein